MACSFLLDTFPSCYTPVGHISCGRGCVARFPCVHICQFSFNGEMDILALCWYDLLGCMLRFMVEMFLLVNVDASLYCHLIDIE